MSLFNPFSYVNKEKISRRAGKLLRKYSHLTVDEIAELVIASYCRRCAVVGFLTALPGLEVGLGTLVAVVGGTVVDFFLVAYFMAEMVLLLSLLYRRQADINQLVREALWVYAAALTADAAGKGAKRLATGQLARVVSAKLVEDILVNLGIRAGRRTILRILPLLGAVLAGGINHYACRRVGRLVKEHYRHEPAGRGDEVIVEGKTAE